MPANIIHKTLAASMQAVPKPVVWHFSRRYIAGTRLEDAWQTVRRLNGENCTATIDVLGEDSTNADEVQSARDLYFRALDGIVAEGLSCGVSVKLSEMGLRFDEAMCRRVMRSIVERAAERNKFVRIDMEDASVTSVTLNIYRELRRDFDNVGTVLQSCLHRCGDDVASLLDDGVTNIRLCKGIYIESEDIAYHRPDDIRNAYMKLLEQLLEGGAKVGIATHDPVLVRHAEETIMRLKLPPSRYEFQMLLGVAGPLRRRLVAQGHPMRVYVPFGERWFAYSMRRLRENPHIVGHIVKNLFRAH